LASGINYFSNYICKYYYIIIKELFFSRIMCRVYRINCNSYENLFLAKHYKLKHNTRNLLHKSDMRLEDICKAYYERRPHG